MNTFMLLGIAVMLALAVGLVIYSLIPQSSDVSRRLATYGGTLQNNTKHILVFEQAMNADERSTLARSLQEAGWYKTSPGLYKAMQAGSALGGLAIAAIGYVFMPTVLWLFFPILGYLAVPFKLGSAKKQRKLDIQCIIPEFIDALSIAVGAGVALNAAMINAVEFLPGALADELKAALADIRMGRSRADALNAMSARVNQPDLAQLVTALVQSEKVGGNVSQVLNELAAEARSRRFARAEEIANVLPLKMTFPMAVLLLPSLLCFIFGPIIAGVMSANATGK